MADGQSLRDRLRDAAHLAVLWSFVCAQPIFAVLGGSNSEVFVLARWRAADILAFALLLIALPPLLLWGLEELVSLKSQRARRWTHLVLVGLLTTVGAAYLIKRSDPSAYASLAIAPLVGAAGAFAYTKFDAVRLGLTYLSPAPLVFAGVFLLSNPVAHLVFPADPELATGQPTESAPVVLVILDELPTASLMNRKGELDAASYPGFASIARNATWYRRGSSVHTFTTSAVPSILTGDYAPTDAPPSSAAYPRSVFTALAGSYRMSVQEYLPLCPASVCPGEESASAGPRIRHLIPTIGKVALDEYLPERWIYELPRVDPVAKPQPTPAQSFADLERSFRADEPRTLHFIHVVYPHGPWTHAPDGSAYGAAACCELDFLPNAQLHPQLGLPVFLDEEITTNSRAVLGFQQRHLAQVRDADRILLTLSRSLKRSGLYRKALIVVTADHGVAFDPGSHLRELDAPVNAGEVMGVPFFVKRSGQRRGRVSDRHVRTIDILPTVANELGMKIPWPVDGKPIVAGDHPPEPKRLKVIETLSGRTSFVPVREFDRQLFWTARRNDRSFGPATAGVQLYQDGPAGRLIGDRIRQLGNGNAVVGGVTLDQAAALDRVVKESGDVPTLISGSVTLPPGSHFDAVAIAINGRVRSTAWMYPSRQDRQDLHFQTMVPPFSLRNGNNPFQIFGFSSGRPDRSLARLRVESAPLP